MKVSKFSIYSIKDLLKQLLQAWIDALYTNLFTDFM